jgi:hypothetical protein
MGALQVVTILLRLVHQSRGEPGAPPASSRPPAFAEAPEAPSARSDLLGLAFPPVARLAVESARRPAGDRPPLAVLRLPSLLALEITEAMRPAEARRGDPWPHPSHVLRQFHLGTTPDSLGASFARLRGRGADGGQVHGSGNRDFSWESAPCPSRGLLPIPFAQPIITPHPVKASPAGSVLARPRPESGRDLRSNHLTSTPPRLRPRGV